MSDEVPNEIEVRRMRDMAYGSSISDREWEWCKENWMKPENVMWLDEHQPEE